MPCGGRHPGVGRPKGSKSRNGAGAKINDQFELAQAAREYGRAALEMMLRTMESPRAAPAACLKAANSILAWGWGKPSTSVAPEVNEPALQVAVNRRNCHEGNDDPRGRWRLAAARSRESPQVGLNARSDVICGDSDARGALKPAPFVPVRTVCKATLCALAENRCSAGGP